MAFPSRRQGPVLPGEHRLASSLLTSIDNDIVWQVAVTYHENPVESRTEQGLAQERYSDVVISNPSGPLLALFSSMTRHVPGCRSGGKCSNRVRCGSLPQ